jgi:hypothetical protein
MLLGVPDRGQTCAETLPSSANLRNHQLGRKLSKLTVPRLFPPCCSSKPQENASTPSGLSPEEARAIATLNSTMLKSFKCSSDGSLTIYGQRASPGAVTESNWLPAPDGPFYAILRI